MNEAVRLTEDAREVQVVDRILDAGEGKGRRNRTKEEGYTHRSTVGSLVLFRQRFNFWGFHGKTQVSRSELECR